MKQWLLDVWRIGWISSLLYVLLIILALIFVDESMWIMRKISYLLFSDTVYDD